ncbi:Uncharacterized protein FWK35_00008874 [Aphis craccivora]|uniref:Uncharacterized protein n=2 Tax=Aphis craccivora TaxID=307492 RepID=A0A6G0YBM7_APHCR|nr:Uncharacterized protein FWK35_00008874 [Aphis craccivora]
MFNGLHLRKGTMSHKSLGTARLDILDSERSDECIDFTMLCCVFFFFLCLCTQERVEIMLQFKTLGVVSDSKMNLVGAFGRSFFEFPNSFQKRREKPKIQKSKIKEKWEFLCKTMLIKKFWMPKIQIFTKSVENAKICKIKNTTLGFPKVFLQCNDSDLSSNDIKYFISRRYLKILPFILIAKKSSIPIILILVFTAEDKFNVLSSIGLLANLRVGKINDKTVHKLYSWEKQLFCDIVGKANFNFISEKYLKTFRPLFE